MKLITRRKVIVVPFIKNEGGQIQFLIVKDRKSKEWTFVTGGCKANEPDMDAARRELKEETRNVMDIDIACIPHVSFRFKTVYREKHELAEDKHRNERVITLYSVYILDITDVMSIHDVKSQFRATKNMKGVYNENTDLNFETLESFSSKTHVWKFIREHVLQNTQFVRMIQGQAVVSA